MKPSRQCELSFSIFREGRGIKEGERVIKEGGGGWSPEGLSNLKGRDIFLGCTMGKEKGEGIVTFWLKFSAMNSKFSFLWGPKSLVILYWLVNIYQLLLRYDIDPTKIKAMMLVDY